MFFQLNFISAMNRRIPVIHESASELKELLNQSLPKRSHERIHALYLLKSGQAKNRQAVSFLLGRHRHTIREWLDRYESEGLSSLLELKTSSNRQSSLTENELDQLKKRLDDPAGFGSYGEIQTWIETKLGKSIIYPTVHRLVRYRLKSKLKVPRKVHIDKDEALSLRFKKTSLRS